MTVGDKGKPSRIHDLQNMPINRLIWRYALPAIIASSVNALYNIITRFFVGNTDYIGDAALASLGIALPIMILIAAFGMLVGVGSASRISIYLGNDDQDSAEKVLGNALILTFLITLPVSLILLYFLEPIVLLLGAEGESIHYTYDFLLIFLPGSLFSALCFGFNNMMRASGYPQKAMYTMLLTLVINAATAYLFVNQLEWGVKGAALAIVVSMFVGALFVLYHFLFSSQTLRFRWRNVRLNWPIVKAIISIGMSPFFMVVIASSVVVVVIQQVATYGGENGIGAYTIVNGILMLVVMILVGLTQGMQPIVGYNYGAKNFKRMREALFYTIKMGVVIGTIAMIGGLIFPEKIVAIFNPKEREIFTMSVTAMKIGLITFPIVGFQVVVTNFFQSIGKVAQSIFLSLSRQLIFLVPAVLIMPRYFGLNGVWSALPVSDILAALAAVILLWYQVKKFKAMEAKLDDRQ